jgi:AAA domain
MSDEERADLWTTAAGMLATSLDVHRLLVSGQPVLRALLHPDVLDAIGEPRFGNPFVLNDDLALRIKVARPLLAADGGEPPKPTIVTLDEFADVNEAGAEALVGTPDDALIPVNADVLTYGDGGSGKTTLMLDRALHLAAGDDWLGLPVARPCNVLMIEAEGPRPLFRRKLRRKRDAWQGSALGGRLVGWEDPWGQFTFADPEARNRPATRGTRSASPRTTRGRQGRSRS